jgi:lysozyme family protein
MFSIATKFCIPYFEIYLIYIYSKKLIFSNYLENVQKIVAKGTRYCYI